MYIKNIINIFFEKKVIINERIHINKFLKGSHVREQRLYDFSRVDR